ncbi:hypothetical protein MLD38_034138 [Melastoma candidum]|uniref:Uncharacterized protein n=1 Tax=Melastoma candidum TaxID=119954 RepID=A0ACB9M8N3_9MYRT|nr:hypothetical protein MLD38_034138 [Melastoma candidum]
MSGRPRDAVKVKIIDTQYVETDASSFKSVVQKLTGKDTDSSSAGSRKTTNASSSMQGGYRGYGSHNN